VAATQGFSDRLAALIAVDGRSVPALAEAADVPKQTIYNYLKGAGDPAEGPARKVAAALGVPFESLWRGDLVPTTDRILDAAWRQTTIMRLEELLSFLKEQSPAPPQGRPGDQEQPVSEDQLWREAEPTRKRRANGGTE
jgi:transcriptional regulator with XRE-family HTH domain